MNKNIKIVLKMSKNNQKTNNSLANETLAKLKELKESSYKETKGFTISSFELEKELNLSSDEVTHHLNHLVSIHEIKYEIINSKSPIQSLKVTTDYLIHLTPG